MILYLAIVAVVVSIASSFGPQIKRTADRIEQNQSERLCLSTVQVRPYC
jgi:hypothetical protein